MPRGALPSHNVQTFTVASSGSSTFALNSLDWATSNEDIPTVFTIIGYRGGSEIVRVEGVDIASGGTYGAFTDSELTATNLVPGHEETILGMHLAFSGSGWGNIDSFSFEGTGNDIFVILDNIQFSVPSVIPEPGDAALILGSARLPSPSVGVGAPAKPGFRDWTGAATRTLCQARSAS